MRKREPRPCGLLIKLEKDVLGVSHIKNGSNFVMGYFDRVIFDHVNRWLDFSPRKSSEGQGGNPSRTGNPLSIYPIKLLFPTDEMISNLERLNFDYQSWMGDFSRLLDANPCVTIALLNLTDQFKRGSENDICGEQLSRLADVIYNGQYSHGENHPQNQLNFIDAGGADAHVCLLPSLGYSDYCLLIAEKNWTFAPELFEYLHRARSKDEIVLSTDYVMPVYHILSNDPEHREKPTPSGSQISIHIHLKPGISMGQLAQCVGDVADVWQVSGSSDCVLVSKKGKTPKDLFCDFSLGIRGNTNCDFQNLVLGTESKLQRKIMSLPPVEDSIPPTEENSKIADLRHILLAYRELLYEENKHMRLFNATWERVTLVESICSQAHNDELREIMDRWLDVFTYCLKQEVEDLQILKQELPSVKRKEEREKLLMVIEEIWTEMQNALNIFVTHVGSFLADLSRSDSFSMESERYNHASVGSATKLLLAYNRWQNQFVIDMQEAVNSRSEYAFLVRSGGCDSTNTDSIFPYLDVQLSEHGEEKKMFERKPLITHMSEMALYDCGGAIFRMTHECMHYCGERKRKERAQAMITFISRYYGRAFSQTLFGRDEYYVNLCEQLKTQFGLEIEELKVELEECWKSAFISLLNKITSYISTQLQNQFKKDRAGWDERNYMGNELHMWLKRALTGMFLSYDVTSGSYYTSDIIVELYNSVLEAVKDYYDNCDEVIQRNDDTKHLIFCAIERRKAEKKLTEFQEDGEFTDNYLWNQIKMTLTWFLSDPNLPTMNNDSFMVLQGHTVSEVLNFMFESFSETFADVTACVRLDASLSDYLLAFIFESWDLDEAFPLGEAHVYRIPIVLRLCYQKALQLVDNRMVLSAEAKQELQDAIWRLVMHGMPERRINSELLYERIEELMNLYQNHGQWIAQPLEEYLCLCKEQHEQDAKRHGYMKKYQKAFQKIRLLDGFNHPGPDADYADQVVQMLTSLITIGKKDGDARDAERTEV